MFRSDCSGQTRADDSKFPSNVISWHNLSAEDDYTCHDTTLADDFKKMMLQQRVSAVHDYRIFNLAVRYGKFQSAQLNRVLHSPAHVENYRGLARRSLDALIDYFRLEFLRVLDQLIEKVNVARPSSCEYRC